MISEQNTTFNKFLHLNIRHNILFKSKLNENKRMLEVTVTKNKSITLEREKDKCTI